MGLPNNLFHIYSIHRTRVPMRYELGHLFRGTIGWIFG